MLFNIFSPSPVYAAGVLDSINSANPAKNFLPTADIGNLLSGGGTTGAFSLLNLIFVIIGIVFFANLIMAGWDYMFSSGDPKKVAAASTRLVNGFYGIVLAVMSFLIIRIVTTALGITGI
jgi:hypothetical protein